MKFNHKHITYIDIFKFWELDVLITLFWVTGLFKQNKPKLFNITKKIQIKYVENVNMNNLES